MEGVRFFIKTFIITVIAILLMQIRIGANTIETDTMSFLTSSSIVRPIDSTAHGAVIFIRNTWTKVTSSINTNFSHALHSDNQPGTRGGFINFERSKEYVEKKAKQAELATERAVENPKGVFEGMKNAANRAEHKIQRHLRNEGILEQDIVDETYVPGRPPNSEHTAKHDGDDLDSAPDSVER